ncbi:MAG: hypothetical protein EHM70_18675 [Chloroflexota bacterium]|nr:MAG: hypothetical protein EHM70_18675 [Chloroflexota bacterium]
MNKKLTFILVLFGLLAFLVAPAFGRPAWAQDEEEELTLRMSRDFGYSSGSGSIQGTVTMKVTGPDDLARVVFLIDDEPIGEDTEAPFSLRFTTDVYPLGEHTLSGVGYTTSEREVRSITIRANFVSADEGWQAAGKILGPVGAVIVIAILLSSVVPLITGRKAGNVLLGAWRSYGLFGGTICPRCQRPFGRHAFGLNLLVGKFDRCPYCGKWSLMRSYSMDKLKAAEAAELERATPETPAPVLSEEEKLRKELDDSRFQNL